MANIYEMARKAGTTVFDIIFKTSILILLAVFLLLYYQNSKNGRYYLHHIEPTKPVMVMDSATGSIYVPAWVGELYGGIYKEGWTDGRDRRFFLGKR